MVTGLKKDKKIKSSSKKFVYITTAYRYGDRLGYSYLVGVFSNKNLAIEQAVSEENFRGIKYRCEVVKVQIDHIHNPYKKETITVYSLKNKL